MKRKIQNLSNFNFFVGYEDTDGKIILDNIKLVIK